MKHISLLLCVLVAGTMLAGCSEEDKVVSGAFSYGSIDNSVYVAVGNSLTAGYQSGALFKSGQQYSFPNLIAGQLSTSFTQPLMDDPGTGTMMDIVSLTPPTISRANFHLAQPSNIAHPAPYNNLGIPGSIGFDAIDTSNLVTKFNSRQNPFFQLVMRDQATFGYSMLEQALKLNPTVVTFWLGNNDVLGFATSGGTSPKRPTNSNFFGTTMLESLKRLRTARPNAAILIGNIPDVKDIPFFTTVGPSMAPILAAQNLDLYYQLHDQKGPAAAKTRLSGLPDDPMITLSGSTYAPMLGQPTGTWYRDLAASLNLPLAVVLGVQPGVDTTKPFGFHPQNPWPDALALDKSEQDMAKTAVNEFNDAIRSAAAQYEAKVVDVNALLTEVNENGITLAGETLGSTYISGGLFSLDGVHPSSKGAGVIANHFIKAMNSNFSANISYVDLSGIPGIKVPKMSKRNLLGYEIPAGTFDFIHYLYR